MTNEEVPSNVNIGIINKFMRSVLILSISFLSVLCDILIGSALIIQYYSIGHKTWAIVTFSFIFFPSVVLQSLSIKLYLSDRNMVPMQWFFHSLLLGIINRYIIAFRKCVKSYKSKSCIDSFVLQTDVIILKKLYLFKSFFECAPQLVLQLYFMTVAPFLLQLSGIFAITSAFSIIWALIIHTKIKKGNDCFGLVFLILWRIGMIVARISALVLCAYICGPWMILFIGSHWLAMTLWITYQKAAIDEKDKKGEFHSALFGIIYCFCFFSVKTGNSRSKAVILNSLLLFQNLIFLSIFLMSFSTKSPRLAILSFITVIFGSLLGISSFFIYNTFFHPRGPFKCIALTKRSICCGTAECFSRKQFNFPILTSRGRKSDNISSRPENEQLQDIQSPSDSIVIIEENPTPNPKVNRKIVERPTEDTENIYDEPKLNEIKKETEEVNLCAALKRRAICSSVDLTRFLDGKTENTVLESNRSSKVFGAEETQEILSTHDYENLCAVNIAREPWGIRSWRVYSDIETWRHDDSVFNERRLDNMTTSSECSGKIEDKDMLNIAEDDLLNSEIDTNSDKMSVYFVPPFPASMLHTILEERESPPGCVHDVEGIKSKCNSESALVATIDKICLYTPLRIRAGSIDNYVETPEIRKGSVKKIENVRSDEESRTRRELPLESGKKDDSSALKEKIRSVNKFNVFKERYETNRYQVCRNITDSKPEAREDSRRDAPNKENVSDKSCGREHNGAKKSFSFKDGSLLVRMLTPTKVDRRTFPITPPKR